MFSRIAPTNRQLGLIRSWDALPRRFDPTADPSDHFLVIMDSMVSARHYHNQLTQMNLDIMYQATELTGDARYASAATSHARVCARTHIRDDQTTYHVVDFDPRTGEVQARFSAQGE